MRWRDHSGRDFVKNCTAMISVAGMSMAAISVRMGHGCGRHFMRKRGSCHSPHCGFNDAGSLPHFFQRSSPVLSKPQELQVRFAPPLSGGDRIALAYSPPRPRSVCRELGSRLPREAAASRGPTYALSLLFVSSPVLICALWIVVAPVVAPVPRNVRNCCPGLSGFAVGSSPTSVLIAAGLDRGNETGESRTGNQMQPS